MVIKPTNANRHSAAIPPALQTQLRLKLQQLGLSRLGTDQVLTAQAVSDPADRARIAQLIVTTLTNPSGVHALEHYDYPGAYAQKYE